MVCFLELEFQALWQFDQTWCVKLKFGKLEFHLELEFDELKFQKSAT